MEPAMLPPLLTLTASLPLTSLAWTKAVAISEEERAVAVEVVRADVDRLMSPPLVTVLLRAPKAVLNVLAAGSP